MAGLGIGIAWLGYSVLYYGVTQVQGGNWGLFDLMLPTRWAKAAGNPRDDGTSAAAKPSGNNNSPGSTTSTTKGSTPGPTAPRAGSPTAGQNPSGGPGVGPTTTPVGISG